MEALSSNGLNCSIFLSIVLPAYNEEASIEDVILDHLRVATKLHKVIAGWEIICVDDASTDQTSRLLKSLASSVENVRIVHHEVNKGIFKSFDDGFAVAKGTHVYATGADGQWPAANLERMLPLVMAGFDLVVGVRLNRKEVYSLKRRFVSFAFNLSTRLLFGLDTVDAGSIKLGVRDVFSFDLISHGPFVEAERIIKAHRSGYRVDFVPIEFKARLSGKETGARLSNVVAGTVDCLRCAAVYGIGRTRKTSVDTGKRV